MTAKYANHAKEEANWGFLSRIWRISRLSLFASCRRPLLDLCAPVVKIRAKQSQFRRLAYPTILLFYHSTIPRQTNPICGRAEGRISAVWIRSCDELDAGEAVKNKPNLAVVGSQ